MPINYAAEKLSYAVRKLVVGKGRIKERLKEAAVDVEVAGASNMPADFLAKYETVLARLTAHAREGNESASDMTIRQMSEDEACDIAKQILDLADEAADRAFE